MSAIFLTFNILTYAVAIPYTEHSCHQHSTHQNQWGSDPEILRSILHLLQIKSFKQYQLIVDILCFNLFSTALEAYDAEQCIVVHMLMHATLYWPIHRLAQIVISHRT